MLGARSRYKIMIMITNMRFTFSSIYMHALIRKSLKTYCTRSTYSFSSFFTIGYFLSTHHQFRYGIAQAASLFPVESDALFLKASLMHNDQSQKCTSGKWPWNIQSFLCISHSELTIMHGLPDERNSIQDAKTIFAIINLN